MEFYLLTAGMLKIPRATGITAEFEAMWGGELHFDETGEVAFIKRIITHPAKTRYLLQLSESAFENSKTPCLVNWK